jgi:hypothetical protein
MRIRALIFLVIIFSFNYSVIGQHVIEKDVKSLHYIINKFLQKRDKYYESRKDEFIFMILELDSSGIIANIHLLVDKKNVDTSYSILEKMKPDDFGGYKFETWKNKVINLQVYSLTGGARNYVDGAIIQHSNAWHSRKAIMIEPLYYMTPGGNPRSMSASASMDD